MRRLRKDQPLISDKRERVLGRDRCNAMARMDSFEGLGYWALGD
jgi:hypothetical protein